MADPNPTADGVAGTEADPNAPEFSLQNINLELDTATEILSPDLREIVLRISVTAKNGDATAFLVEVQQGGIFAVRNLGEEDYRRAVASIGPNVLFPYARAQIANLVTQGGFPQLLLPPVNFELLYARSRAEAAEAQTQAAQQPLNS
jgi:preprotein translocase subunit SecB